MNYQRLGVLCALLLGLVSPSFGMYDLIAYTLGYIDTNNPDYLTLAAERGDLGTLKLFINDGKPLTVLDSNNRSPILVAIDNKQFAFLSEMLCNIPQKELCLFDDRCNMPKCNGIVPQRALYRVIYRRWAHYFQERDGFLGHLTKRPRKLEEDFESNDVYFQMFCTLIKYGIGLDEKDSNKTPIFDAVCNNFMDMVKLLLFAGANKKIKVLGGFKVEGVGKVREILKSENVEKFLSEEQIREFSKILETRLFTLFFFRKQSGNELMKMPGDVKINYLF